MGLFLKTPFSCIFRRRKENSLSQYYADDTTEMKSQNDTFLLESENPTYVQPDEKAEYNVHL